MVEWISLISSSPLVSSITTLVIGFLNPSVFIVIMPVGSSSLLDLDGVVLEVCGIPEFPFQGFVLFSVDLFTLVVSVNC